MMDKDLTIMWANEPAKREYAIIGKQCLVVEGRPVTDWTASSVLTGIPRWKGTSTGYNGN